MDNEIAIICPEGLEIAQAYLANGSSAEKAAQELGLPIEVVHRHLAKREVTAYIDRMFLEAGALNRDTMARIWEEILKSKLEEMDDTGLASSKDIVEIMEKMHAFKMKELEMQIKLRDAEAKSKGPTIQVNQQNNYSGGDNYNKLLDKLLGD